MKENEQNLAKTSLLERKFFGRVVTTALYVSGGAFLATKNFPEITVDAVRNGKTPKKVNILSERFFFRNILRTKIVISKNILSQCY